MKIPIVVTKDSTGIVYNIPAHWRTKRVKNWLKLQKEKRQHTHAQGHIRHAKPEQLELFQMYVTTIKR